VDLATTTVGADQGSSASPIVFAVGLKKSVSQIKAFVRSLMGKAESEELRSELFRILRYLDDLLVVVPKAHAALVAREIESLMHGAGLNINWSKCKTWIPDESEARPHQTCRWLSLKVG
jgi:hypothetical protein